MSGFIYLITMEPDEYVKIGFTRSNPALRMATLQTGCPEALHLRGWWPGTPAEERALHEVFAPLRYNGEWFFNKLKLGDFVLYFDEYREKMAPRERFEDALHDTVMQSHWYPFGDISQEEHDASATWEPFRSLLWNLFGPWEDM